MILTIDNLDGQGAVDYSSAIARGGQPLQITRTLNAPSTAKATLCLAGTSLARPIRQARVVMSSNAGTTLFTGYLTTEPEAIYAGMASTGPVYQLALSAVSDEWLLDKQAAGSGVGLALAAPAGGILARLADRLDAGRLATSALTSGRTVGVFDPSQAGAQTAWSAHAGAVASAACSSYRAIGGGIALTPAGDVIHAYSDADGTLSIAGLKTASVRELANDVTVSGGLEPTTYWTELFEGDGTTTVFNLAGDPAAVSAGHARVIDEDFHGTTLNTQTWMLSDPGSHLSLSGIAGPAGTGLTLNGGDGYEGDTTLAAWDPIELGGTLVIELGNVALNPASAGYLAGLYSGPVALASCFAAFGVTQSGGQTLVQPIVNGVAVGTSFAMLEGHLYTLRLHLHCPERERVQQSFYVMVDGAVQQSGGGLVDAAVALTFELRDLGQSSNTPANILYDGMVANSIAQASFIPVNSVQLFGSIGSIRVTRTGTTWIESTGPTTGAVGTRLAGAANEGVDCVVSAIATRSVTFLPGRVPAPQDIVTVRYRGSSRAVARLADPASIALEQQGGGVGTSRWVGKILSPIARSSVDCEAAARAILSFATSRAAAVSGSYLAVNPPATGNNAPSDIWPGDVLALTTEGDNLNVVTRGVEIEEHGAVPETLTYRIAFSNDWAEGLGIRLSEAIAADAQLPATAQPLTATTSTIANLPLLRVISASGADASSALNIDTGTAPPAGGGFEVRRRNGGFGTGAGPTGCGDLVLRSPVRDFAIPRAAAEETFFVRMYDGSSPALYSRWSSAVVTHLPIS